ncbi:MAG: hypothetical protein ACYSO4_06740, partial [Planctomycetota bacterium]
HTFPPSHITLKSVSGKKMNIYRGNYGFGRKCKNKFVTGFALSLDIQYCWRLELKKDPFTA